MARVAESGLPLVYVNQVGGQDELVFDGASFALNADGSLAAQLAAFRTDGRAHRLGAPRKRLALRRGAARTRSKQGDEGDYAACVLGLRDYVNKNGFPGVVLGLSGGVDSALCAAMAVDALGPERVRAVMLPYASPPSSRCDDAAACAKALGVRYDVVPIAEPVEGVEAALAPMFAGLPRDVDRREHAEPRARH